MLHVKIIRFADLPLGKYYKVNWTFSDSALLYLRMQTFRVCLGNGLESLPRLTDI